MSSSSLYDTTPHSQACDSFTKQFVCKYSTLDPAVQPIPIYRSDWGPCLPSHPASLIPEYTVAHINGKIQLTSSDPRNTTHTILAYQKKQRIDIRNSPELLPDSALLDSIPLEWYSPYSKNKLYDLKLANGKLYRWWFPGQGSGVLQLIDITEDSATKGKLIAQVAINRTAKATLVISVTDAIYTGSTTGVLAEDTVLASVFGVVKKAEKGFMHSAWYDEKKTLAGNGFKHLATFGADLLFRAPIN